jgi:hypothetical protein
VKPILSPCSRSRALVANRGVVEHAALERGGVDLVEREVVAEQRATLGRLPPKVVDGEVLLLVTLSVDAPVGRIDVTPLGTNRDLAGRNPARVEPRSKKLLGPPVTASRIEVSNASRECSIEHPRKPCAREPRHHLPGEIAPVAEIDVTRLSKRGEPEPDRAGPEPGAAEDALVVTHAGHCFDFDRERRRRESNPRNVPASAYDRGSQ